MKSAAHVLVFVVVGAVHITAETNQTKLKFCSSFGSRHYRSRRCRAVVVAVVDVVVGVGVVGLIVGIVVFGFAIVGVVAVVGVVTGVIVVVVVILPNVT